MLPVLLVLLAIPVLALPAAGKPREERVQVSLVLLDTVVTDKKGAPVTGLGIKDFDLLVDNTRVPIDSLELKCGAPGDASMASSATDVTRADARHVVVLFDVSHMMPQSRNDAIRATLNFVDNAMTARDQVMVLACMRGLHVISGFSSDRSMLKEKLQNLLGDTSLVDSAPLEEANTIQQLGTDRRRPMFGGPGEHRRAPPGSNPAHLLCAADARQAEMQTARALRAIANMMPALAGVPGRKAVVFFTETLRANPGIPFYTACGMSFLEQLTFGMFVLPELEELKLKANIAGVSFYPVHAGGMSPLGSSEGQQSSRDFQADIALTTGGKNYVLMKQPLEPFRQAVEDLSCYYVLAYRPPELFSPGRHVVKVSSSGKSLRVRHREYFTIQSQEEASESQLLAALSSPAIYRDLPVSAHAYSLGGAEARKRQVLLHVSVPATALTVARTSEDMSSGSVLFRGGIVSGGKLRCEFSETVPFQAVKGPVDPASVVGLETLCALDAGDQEVVVVGRDETGGGLGTFWGKIVVKPAQQHAGAAALLWDSRDSDVWVRPEGVSWLPSGTGPFFVRDSFTIRSNAPAAMTILVCNDGKDSSASPVSRDAAGVHLSGPTSVDLPVVEIPESGHGSCRLLRADISPGTLSAGAYAVQPRPVPPWHAIGTPVEIQVR